MERGQEVALGDILSPAMRRYWAFYLFLFVNIANFFYWFSPLYDESSPAQFKVQSAVIILLFALPYLLMALRAPRRYVAPVALLALPDLALAMVYLLDKDSSLIVGFDPIYTFLTIVAPIALVVVARDRYLRRGAVGMLLIALVSFAWGVFVNPILFNMGAVALVGAFNIVSFIASVVAFAAVAIGLYREYILKS